MKENSKKNIVSLVVLCVYIMALPTGYNKMENKTFKIKFDTTEKKFNVTGGLDSLVATIKNFSGSTLPSTGGIGTTIFYIVGAVLVIGAAILLVTKKRMSKEA